MGDSEDVLGERPDLRLGGWFCSLGSEVSDESFDSESFGLTYLVWFTLGSYFLSLGPFTLGSYFLSFERSV